MEKSFSYSKDFRSFCSYDMQAATKELKHSWKNLMPAVGIEPGPPG